MPDLSAALDVDDFLFDLDIDSQSAAHRPSEGEP
jgi:hypothetical protein